MPEDSRKVKIKKKMIRPVAFPAGEVIPRVAPRGSSSIIQLYYEIKSEFRRRVYCILDMGSSFVLSTIISRFYVVRFWCVLCK